MTTLTIDIPDDHSAEVIAQLKKLGVKVRESKLSHLDKLTKEDYQKQYERSTQKKKPMIILPLTSQIC